MSSRIVVLLLCSNLILGLSSCGLFGSKGDPDRELDFPQSYGGCFNEAGVRFEQYLKGEIPAQDWSRAWDCTMDSLRLLNKFAGTTTGWSHSDLDSLVTTLVLTDTELPKSFMPAAFELKASLIGGSRETLTAEELQKIIDVFGVIRDESAAFIPHLRTRHEKPAPEGMLQFSRDLAKLIARIGAQFSPRDSAPLARQAVETLIKDLTTVFKWEAPDYVVDVMMAAKVMLTGGSPEIIEPNTWASIFQTLGSVGAPGYAMISADKDLAAGPNEYGEFLGLLAADIVSALEGSVDANGGIISERAISRVIDALPEDLLPVRKQTGKDLFKVVSAKILHSAQAGGLDKPALRRALGYFNRWKRGKTHIERIFRTIPKSGVTQAYLLSALASYRSSVDPADRPEVDRLVDLASNYKSMWAEGDREIIFAPYSLYSHEQMVNLHWMNLVAEVAIEKYSSAPDRKKLSLANFSSLFGDLSDFGVEMNVIDPTVPDFEGRRFREADYYMPISDGDGTVDEREATYYIAYLTSGASPYDRIRKNVEEQCKISDELGPNDWKWMDAQCVRDHFFANVDSYWSHAPQMLEHYKSQSQAMRRELEHDFEAVARLRGFTDDPFGGYDIKALASAMHYVESIFRRYDSDGSQWLSTAETVAASSIFGSAIAEAAGIDPGETDKIEAIFTFIMKNGRRPADGLGGTIEVGAWMLTRPFWNLRVDRNGVYKAFSVLVAPADQESRAP